MNMAFIKNIGAHLRSVVANNSEVAGIPALIIAGGAGDAVKVDGQSIDRMGDEHNEGFGSGQLVVSGFSNLGAADTFSITVEREESDDGSAFVNPVVIRAAIIVATGIGAIHWELRLNEDLTPRRKFVRYNITPDHSAGAADLSTYSAALVLGGGETSPPLSQPA